MSIQKRRASDRTFMGPMYLRIRHARRISKHTQASLAKAVHVGPSAVAQWELPAGTAPTIEHLVAVARVTGVAFEWLSTGRGKVGHVAEEVAAVDPRGLAVDELEERLLIAFRGIKSTRKETFVKWMEEFF